ncbi:hypothetical protein MOSE0_D05336 [Monosporozyma servazzii]
MLISSNGRTQYRDKEGLLWLTNPVMSYSASYPVGELRNVILNKDCLTSTAIPIKLSNGYNFAKWKRLMLMFIKDTHCEWYEYVETGKIDSILLGFSLSARDEKEVVNIMDSALKRLIIATTESLALITVQDYLMNDYTEHTGMGLLKYLGECYGRHKVKYDIANLKQCRTSTSLKDKVNYANEIANIGFSLSDIDNEILSILTSEQKKLFLDERSKRQRYLSSLVFLNSIPRYSEKIVEKFGDEDMITIEQICEEFLSSRLDSEV